MKTHIIRDYKPSYRPAYLANGVVGIRAGENPCMDMTGLLNGFSGAHEHFGVDAYAPIPTPTINFGMDHSTCKLFPQGYQFQEQQYDFANGELTTKFTFTNSNNKVLDGQVLLFCSRTSPTLLMAELQLTPREDCLLNAQVMYDPRSLPISASERQIPTKDVDGVLLLTARGKRAAACGLSYLFTAQQEAEVVHTERDDWGYEQECLAKTIDVQAKKGVTYTFHLVTSYVPSVFHTEPHYQAVRMIKLATWRGFENLRQDNRAAWAEIWESRVVIEPADEPFQNIIDASFFYLYSSMHTSTPHSMGPFGLSFRDKYKGHVFWDTESFMFILPLFTNPQIAYSMLEYRFDRLDAARQNAKINGYTGIQFPWQSMADGVEVTRVRADQAGGAGEQHVNMDVAMAFVAYVNITGDQVFKREKAWPVVKGVSEWIESRVTKTARGYEIHHVTGIDESIDNVPNDAYTNLMCQKVLRVANQWAIDFGYGAQEKWSTIAETMFLPINQELSLLDQFEGISAEKRDLSVNVMHYFPYGCYLGKDIDEGTIRHAMEHGMIRGLTYPMLSGFLGILPTRIGERETAREFLRRGNFNFMYEPYFQSSEFSKDSQIAKENPDSMDTMFITGRGSLMAGLIMGLCRINIFAGEDQSLWLESPIVLPAGIDKITVGKVFLKGKPAKVIAEHGKAEATIEWL